jgi:predicted nucleic acid-binding protein
VASTASLGSAFSQGAPSFRSGTSRDVDARAQAGSQARPNGVSVTSMYLLDTNVVSELRKPKPHGAVVQWIQDAAEADLHISAVTIGEIQAGIEVTREQDEAKASELEQWLDQVATSFNVVPMDAAAFRVWARLMHRSSHTLYEDAMIAAIALVHSYTLVTRNVVDFKQFRIPVLNPFTTARK